jgi:hypothetical protein
VTVERRNRGGGHSYLIDGRDAPGVTTILQALAKPALIEWAANTTAEYAIDHWSDLLDMTPSARLATLKGARWGENRRAIRRGLSVHHLAWQLAAGVEVEIPDDLAGPVESYVRFLDEWNPTPILSESVVASRRFRYCGTLDLLARTPDGRVWLLDVKTGKGIYGETGLQLAAYARADVYLDEDGQEHDMPPVDAIAAVHVREDGYSVRGFDVPIDDLFRTFTHLAAVHRRTADIKAWVSDEVDVPRVAS